MNNDPILRAGTEVSPVFNPNVSGDVIPQPKQPNKFLSILKGVGSAAVGMIPGVGGALSGLLGGGPNFGSMHAMIQQQQRFSMQLLNIQQQVGTQSQEFTAVSNLLKSRHDSEMSAVSNFKS
jgi:hypothetical protein